MSRSRSRSPHSTRRARGNCNDHDLRSDRASDSDDAPRKHKRSSKSDKRKKKEKKSKKSHKKKHATSDRRESDDSDDAQALDATAAAPEADARDDTAAANNNDSASASSAQPLDVRSFFERIKAQEAGKDTVGTVHASGVRPENPTAVVVLEQWECVKRGCGEKNNKRAAACSKCGAMKRLSEWR